jgi:large subunit ribosomal protein L24
MGHIRIRKGDEVLVIAGKDKGQRGQVLRVLHEKNRVIVEGINVVKRHTKPTTALPQGGIVSKPAGIHYSNLQLWSEESSAAGRISIQFIGDGGTHYASSKEAKASFGENAPPRIQKTRVVRPTKREL